MESTEKFVRLPDVCDMFGIKRSAVWKWVRMGKLPKGIKLSYKCTVWRLSELVEAQRALEGRLA